jgi:hypothetical protein
VLVESHLSITPGEGIDFFAKRDEDLLPSPVEIRIDEAVQHRSPPAHVPTLQQGATVGYTQRHE